jgi:RHS repeat-associated protein
VPGVSKINLSCHIPVTEYYLYDGLGSVVMLTDVLGNPTQMYQYDVFGGTQNLRRDPFNKYRFVSLAHDDSLGLTYMNARWYDAGVGRFISRDPMGIILGETQSISPYCYVTNRPLSEKDVPGLFPPLLAFAIATYAATESIIGAVYHAGKACVEYEDAYQSNFDASDPYKAGKAGRHAAKADLLKAGAYALGVGAVVKGYERFVESESAPAPTEHRPEDELVPNPVAKPKPGSTGKDKPGETYEWRGEEIGQWWDPEAEESWRYHPEDESHKEHWDYAKGRGRNRTEWWCFQDEDRFKRK